MLLERQSRQSRPDSSLGFQVKVLKPFEGVFSLHGSGLYGRVLLGIPRKPVQITAGTNPGTGTALCPYGTAYRRALRTTRDRWDYPNVRDESVNFGVRYNPTSPNRAAGDGEERMMRPTRSIAVNWRGSLFLSLAKTGRAAEAKNLPPPPFFYPLSLPPPLPLFHPLSLTPPTFPPAPPPPFSLHPPTPSPPLFPGTGDNSFGTGLRGCRICRQPTPPPACPLRSSPPCAPPVRLRGSVSGFRAWVEVHGSGFPHGWLKGHSTKTSSCNYLRYQATTANPHGGVHPFRQKSTCITQSTLGSDVVQIWSRYCGNFHIQKPSYSTEWFVVPLGTDGTLCRRCLQK